MKRLSLLFVLIYSFSLITNAQLFQGLDDYDPLTLFTDRSCSELKTDVTQELINNCSAFVYKDIATKLLNNTYQKEFRIDSFIAYPNPSLDAATNKTAKYGVMDSPTGIAVMSNDTLLVFVEGIQTGFPVTLKIQTLTMTDPTIGYNSGLEISLKNGVNKIATGTLSATTGGLGYIRYYYQGNTQPSNIKINFYGGTVNGYFDSQKHTASDWSRLRNAATNTFFDLKGKYSTVTLPRQYINTYASTRGLDLINIYDEIVRLEWKYMGLLPEPEGFGGQHRSRAYFVYMAMPEGVGANATDYRTAYPDPRIADPAYILNESGNSRDMIWVFGHEHGHVNQTRPGFKWPGMTEVTNNLHSLCVQTEISKAFPKSKNSALNNRLQKEKHALRRRVCKSLRKSIQSLFCS
ncbi:MAG: M60 family metallopeptidase [Paludibacteraceae bacterium]